MSDKIQRYSLTEHGSLIEDDNGSWCFASVVDQQAAELERVRRELEEAKAGIKRLSDEEELISETGSDEALTAFHLAARLAEAEELARVMEAESNQMREVSISNRHRAEAAEAKLAEARKAAFIEAAEIAQNITSAECREIISEEKWVDMTDDYGEHIGQMKQGACFRLNFRKGIAAALRAKAEETGR